VTKIEFLESHVPNHTAVFHYLVLLFLQVRSGLKGTVPRAFFSLLFLQVISGLKWRFHEQFFSLLFPQVISGLKGTAIIFPQVIAGPKGIVPRAFFSSTPVKGMV
jgi:hypothetical protein